MLEELTADSVYATILMQEPPARAVLLVEGPDDDMILGDHLRRGVVGIVCGGRRVVIEAVAIAEGEGRREVYGLVDRDLIREIHGEEDLPAGVVCTETYDLTSDIAAARPGAIKMAVLANAFREARAVAEARGQDVEQAVFEIASMFAGIRIAVQRAGYPIRLEGFDFSRVLGSRLETLGAEVFAGHLRVTKPDAFIWNDDIIDEMRAAMSASAGLRELCGGHDLAGAAHGLVSAAGGRQFSKSAFEAAIRVHATCELLALLACTTELQRRCADATGVRMFDCIELAA